MSPKRIKVNESFYDAHLKLLKCVFSNCQVTSKRKSNLKRHMKNCETQKKRKLDKNTYPYYKATFSQKYNHVYMWRTFTKKMTNDEKVMEAPEETMERTFQENITFKCHLGQMKRYKMLHLQVKQGKFSMLV